MPRWREFPSDLANNRIERYDLMITLKTRRELTGFFNHEIDVFDVGDEFETYYESYSFVNPPQPAEKYTSYVISKIIHKKTSFDTTIYTISRQVWNQGMHAVNIIYDFGL